MKEPIKIKKITPKPFVKNKKEAVLFSAGLAPIKKISEKEFKKQFKA